MNTPLTDTERGGGCTYAGPGRGDCEHFIGLPGHAIAGMHDGPDDTVDVYGKPNGWCWSCWKSHQLRDLRAENERLWGLPDIGWIEWLSEGSRQEFLQELDEWKATAEHEEWLRRGGVDEALGGDA